MRASLVVFLTIAASTAHAGEWPQILGPNRNGIAADETLSDSWPEAGPPLVWQRNVGSGLAGVVVAAGRVVLSHRVGDELRVEAFSAAKGKPLWTARFPTDFEPSINPDPGPRAMSIIANTRVFAYGPGGRLHAIDFKTGKTLWSRDTGEDFGAREGYFGFGSTPLVEKDRVIVNVGGKRQGAGIVAFDAATGKTLWKALGDDASYSSPIVATIGKKRQVICTARLTTVSLDPATGKINWQLPFGKRGPTVNGANPVLLGENHLFLTAAYGIGAVYGRIEGDDFKTLWESDEILSTQYATPIAHDGKLYGLHGRHDVGVAALRCIDPKQKKVLWSKDNFGYGAPVAADGKLMVLTTSGELVLADLDPERYVELSRARVLRGEVFALPALADGKLYVRDARTLKCLEVGERE